MSPQRKPIRHPALYDIPFWFQGESITEAEFLVSVLLRRDIVDEMTLAAVRRQFRELVRDETDDTTPLENRHFDSQRLFGMMVRTGQIRQRPPNMAPGS